MNCAHTSESTAHRHSRSVTKRLSCLAVVAVLVLPAQEARADFVDNIVFEFFKGVLAVGLVGGIGIGANAAFTVKDASLASDGKLPPTSWAIAETILTPPQALLFNGVLVYAHASGDVDEAPAVNLVSIPAIWTSQMAVHGIWGLASEKVHPSDLYGVSWAIGANLAFTSGAVSAGISKRFGGTFFGIMEMMGTTPTICVGLSKLSASEPDRGAWAALTGWSGALFVHGLVSTVVGLRKTEEDTTKEKKQTALPFSLMPTVVSDGLRNAPGFVAVGKF